VITSSTFLTAIVYRHADEYSYAKNNCDLNAGFKMRRGRTTFLHYTVQVLMYILHFKCD